MVTYAPAGNAVVSDSQLQGDYERWEALWAAQPPTVRVFLEQEAQALATALVRRANQVQFRLPERIVLQPSRDAQAAPLSPDARTHTLGGLVERLTHADIGPAIRERLRELEHSPRCEVATAAGLLGHGAALHLVRRSLPDGRPVTYVPAEDGDLPSAPVAGPPVAEALTAPGDAIAEGDDAHDVLLAPYVPAARRFFIPRWVAFDTEGRLLVGSSNEAAALVASMQSYMRLLQEAVALAPHIVADQTYRRKRAGMLGQLVNQGRALARYQTGEIIALIRERAAAHALDRGLSVDLPYFDDQALELRSRGLEIIPAGRIQFVPAFVVRAAREERARAAQDTRLSLTTRRHLLRELQLFERAFFNVLRRA
jgi:hypothetical protein